MAWDTVLVERLRYYIYDLDSTNYTFTDLQLQKFLAISTINVVNDLIGYEAYIGGPYSVDTSTSGSNMINPDPINASGSVIGFSNLIVAQSACIIGQAELKRMNAQGAGWKVVDDRSTIDGTKALDASQNIARTYCEAYSDILNEFKMGNRHAGLAILSPYNSPNGSRYVPNMGNPYGWPGGF